MFLKNLYYCVHPKYIGANHLSLLRAWEGLKNLISFLNDNLSGIIFLFFLLSYLVIWSPNRRTLLNYKRENGNNDEKFTTKRCLEDGDEEHRDHIYLINEKNKTYQRIEDIYTLYQLGYARSPRKDDYCFSKKDYEIKERIKIYNVLNSIKVILKLKDK